MKANGEKISMLTAYDFTFANLLDESGVDMLLVGDSAGNVMAGYDTTLPVTLDQMIYHAASVVRGVRRAMVVADLPFGSYQGDARLALASAVRMMKETGVQAVKIEGGIEIADAVRMIVQAGIPVMGHLGLTPQSINQFGTYAVRAQEAAEANKLRSDVDVLVDAGIFGLVLEKIPAALATETAQKVKIPVIGIGAGNGCDGQVLVMHDMLGLNESFKPKFVRRFARLESAIHQAVGAYIAEVKSSGFPSREESY